MKKLLTLLFVALTLQVLAQNNPITSINISLPANPDANTANWGTGTSVLTITANAKASAGKIDPAVTESKILVIIKKGGSKICGAYTANTAPASGFNNMVKVWGGRNAAGLLGQDCTLQPGDYELSVQFFGYGAAGSAPLSEEKIKPFTIRGNDQQAYQAPQLISPATGTVFKTADISKPMAFRWTPLIPKPTNPVTYRLSVWQLMQGQTGVQAIKANQPILTKDVENLTQAMASNVITGPCKPPYLCDYVWTVQALGRDGKPLGGNNGTSGINEFKYEQTPVATVATKVAITLTSPANGGSITGGQPKFSWSAKPNIDGALYALKIVELQGTQSPEEAFHTNKPFFEKDSLTALSINYPASAPPFKAGRKYAWAAYIWDRWGNLKNVSGTSATSQFTANTCDVNLGLKVTSVMCLPGTKDANKYRICLAALYSSSVYNLTYAVAGSGFKAYHPSSSPSYPVSNITPALHTQNAGPATTANYCIDVTVPVGQTAIKVGLMGDDNIPGPIVCQAGAEVDVRLPACVTCGCGSFDALIVNKATRYPSGMKAVIPWKCGTAFNFTDAYHCSTSDCAAKTSWDIKKDGVIIKTGSGGPTFGDGFTPTANGTYTITLNAVCNNIKCPAATYSLVVTNCTVPTCDCGKWVSLKVPTAVGTKLYDNGAKITGSCKSPFSFVGGYECTGTAGQRCAAAITWSVTLNGSPFASGNASSGTFTPTANGTYLITLNSSCNGKKCPAATYSVVVSNCTPACDCGKWESDKITTIINTVAGHQSKAFKCGDVWQNVNSATVGNVDIAFSNYICSSSTCTATYAWTITGPVSHSGTTNVIHNVNLSAPGTYIVSIVASCGGKKCGTCKLTIVVVRPPTCDCGKWNPFKVQNAAGTKQYDNGSKIAWSCKNPFRFTGGYTCTGTAGNPCAAAITWAVTLNGSPVASGNTAGGTFTPTANGTYLVTLNSSCNGKKCPAAIYTVTVTDCCNCGTSFGSLQVKHASGVTAEYKCGSKIQWNCQPFTFTSSYQCTGTQPCRAATTWSVKLNNNVVASGNGTSTINGNFNPIVSGTYTITLTASCNGTPCPPCTYTVVVPPAPCPELCNGGFEHVLNWPTNYTTLQTDQANVPCWKTVESDQKIEVWKGQTAAQISTDVPAYSGANFAEVNCTAKTAIYQTFTSACTKTITVSFAHRGRYTGADVMKVLLINGTTSVTLGTFSANNAAWKTHTTIPITVTGGVTYTLRFESVSVNDGHGPDYGGNFLDAVSLNCVTDPRIPR